MDREYTSDRVPSKLTESLEASRDLRRFRRRVVLAKGNDRWELVCCTVEGFLPGERMPQPVPPRRYSKAILCEDFLTGAECLRFANGLQEGNVHLCAVDLQRGQNTQWSTELLPVNNDYMVRAGYVFSLQFSQHGAQSSVRTLLAPDQPYYPDVDAAARDWLPFPVYHGHSDGRNDHVVFLLPEIRAFIADSVSSEKGSIEIAIGGNEADTLSLLIKGAFWKGKEMHHLDEVVSKSRAVLAVPSDADRLEYYLIDGGGTVYDFHREDRFSRLAKSASTLSAIKRTLADQVREACESGEGLHVEYKPFVAPEQGLGSPRRETKLREILTTVVALANTDGGHIYLGVEDDCTIEGIDHDLREWGKAAIDEALVSKYIGALKNRIKEVVHGEVTLRIAPATVGELLVVVIEVPPAESKPVSIQQDHYFYVRKGASNKKLPPDQWKNFLQPNAPSSPRWAD
jgi:hypothetical protein